MVERWVGPGLAGAEEIKGKLTTDLLPGFALDLRQVFATRRR